MLIQVAELPVRDHDRAKWFDVDHFGFEVVADAPIGKDGWRWIELELAGTETILHLVRGMEEAASDGPGLVLVDDEAVATIRRLQSNGGEILTQAQQPPWQPGRTLAEFRDSEGNCMVVSG